MAEAVGPGAVAAAAGRLVLAARPDLLSALRAELEGALGRRVGPVLAEEEDIPWVCAHREGVVAAPEPGGRHATAGRRALDEGRVGAQDCAGAPGHSHEHPRPHDGRARLRGPRLQRPGQGHARRAQLAAGHRVVKTDASSLLRLGQWPARLFTVFIIASVLVETGAGVR